jgi:hypothetical protein
MYRDQYRKFKESPQRDMNVDVQDMDGEGYDHDGMRPSDRQAELGEAVVQSLD